VRWRRSGQDRQIVKEAKVGSGPHVLATFFKGLGSPVTRIGLEAVPPLQWLYAGLTQAGFKLMRLETRHVKAALSAMVAKTDRSAGDCAAHPHGPVPASPCKIDELAGTRFLAKGRGFGSQLNLVVLVSLSFQMTDSELSAEGKRYR
jgi:hypothetical protein